MDETRTPTSAGSSNTPPIPPEASSLKQIRTFQGDVASALHTQKESIFSIQQTEQLKRRNEGYVAEAPSEDDKKRKEFVLLILGSIVLIALGSLGAWFGYSQYVVKTAPPVLETPLSRFISVQEELEINFASTTRDSFVSIIKEKGAGTPTNSIKHFVLKQGSWKGASLTTTAEFLKKLESSAPASLVRAFDPLFMIGTLGESRFVVVNLVSFENAYPGMLAWEKEMTQDIGDIFATGPTLKTIGVESVFRDVISKNKDVRVLYSVGSTSEPVLLYSFFENRMLIITDSLETLKTIVDRLTQELLSR